MEPRKNDFEKQSTPRPRVRVESIEGTPAGVSGTTTQASDSKSGGASDSFHPGVGPSSRQGWPLLKIGLAVVAAIAIGFAWMGPGTEDSHPDFQKHAAAPLMQELSLGWDEHDRGATENLVKRLKEKSMAPSEEELEELGLPPGIQLDKGLRTDLLNDDARLYTLYVRDTCQEDGDVVEFWSIDPTVGVSEQILLTNAGTTITIPLRKGQPLRLNMKGVQDGGGGITVGVFRAGTNQGLYVQTMFPGQNVPVIDVRAH